MTAPVSNANFTTPASHEARRDDLRPDGDRDDRTGTAASAPREDSVSLSTRSAAPAADAGIQSTRAARAVLERVKQLLAEHPAGAVQAHGNIDPQNAAGALRSAA